MNDPVFVGCKVYGRRGTRMAKTAGIVTGTSVCRLEGCGGIVLHVRWPDGHRTYPCSRGCRERTDGSLQIV
jgi:hypothetical protein